MPTSICKALLAIQIFGISESQAPPAAPNAHSASVMQTSPSYTLATVLDMLNEHGQRLIDIEQGQFSPTFDRRPQEADLGKGLRSFLQAQNYDYEMHGDVMVIFDKALRALPEKDCPLNMKISSFKASNVTVKECFERLSKLLNVQIFGDRGRMTRTPMREPFDIAFYNITLRDALFVIVDRSRAQVWNAAVFSIQNKKILDISIQ